MLAIALETQAGAPRPGCVILAPRTGGPPLAQVCVDDREPEFRISYTHSVTRTPVDEIYRIDGRHMVETEIRFVEHGPGLPTAADAGGAFERRDGAIVVRGGRRFETIVMHVDADQNPRLLTRGQTVDLARWGRRTLVMTAHAGACGAPKACL
jgi:hypothetical protein